MKSYYDYRRNKFLQKKNVYAVAELNSSLQLALLTKRIENYYWLKIFDAIGEAYDEVTRASAKASGVEARNWHTPMSHMMAIDVGKARFLPSLSNIIESHEQFFSSIKASLDQDVAFFSDKVEMVLAQKKQDVLFYPSGEDPWELVNKAANEFIHPWTEARNKLTDENLDAALEVNRPNIKLGKELLDSLKQFRHVRRVYFAAEIVAPILFAFLVIGLLGRN